MTPRIWNLTVFLVVGTFVIGVGALEDWYEEYPFGADGIAYFEIARSVQQGDWWLALSPYWSLGYPLILASTRWLFPPDWSGDWMWVRLVSLGIYIATYVSLLYFVRVALAFASGVTGAPKHQTRTSGLYVVSSLIFLDWQMQAKLASRTTPDLMVCCLFFLVIAAMLRFCLRPSTQTALLLGLSAGFGYITKAAFLPLALVVLAIATLWALTRPARDRGPALAKLMWAAPAFALLVLPYVVGLSLELGRPTLGESGGLNYAWTVNKLPHWHWIGGPPEFGAPIHPARLVCASPHAYEFAEPYHVIYPVFLNPYYWYEGYHHVFKLRNEISAIHANLLAMSGLFFDSPHAPLKAAICLPLAVTALFFVSDINVYRRRLAALWPIYVPALFGLTMYIMVCIESRYLVAFIIVLLLTPLLPLLVPTPIVKRHVAFLGLGLVALVCLAHVVHLARPLVARALCHELYTQNEDWRVGIYLAAHGPPPGTRVAMVKVEHEMQNTWAYIPGLHIVGQIGNQDFNEAQQQEDFHLFTDHPEVQKNIFDLFRKAGAAWVVAMEVKGAPLGDGWTHIPGSKAWLHQL